MDMDQASVFLAGSILIGLGITAIAIAIIFINNLCARYWKPVSWIRYDQLPPRFIEETRTEPTVANTAPVTTTTTQ
jgi:hypothetical protein